MRRAIWIVTALALAYSAVHFVNSGVLYSLDRQSLEKFDEQLPALRTHLATGKPVHYTSGMAQYGPVFFFVMHPMLTHASGPEQLSTWLYALALACVAVGFVATVATLKPLVEPKHRPLAIAWLAILWLNFTPLLGLLVTKSVETWELMLISLGAFAYTRGHRWLTAVAIGAASLVKMLPLIFVVYFVLTDRRTFVYTCVVMAAILLVAQGLYGSEMGWRYLPSLARGASGDSFGLRWHENLSIKAAITKMFGHLARPENGSRVAYTVVQTLRQTLWSLRIGDLAALWGAALYIWAILRRMPPSSREGMLSQWALTTVAMLILSPNTTFENITLALGTISFVAVEAFRSRRRLAGDYVTLVCVVGALLLLGALVPRGLLNRVTLVPLLVRWSGYEHLTPSDAYDYYCFPLVGLFLLLAAIWRLQPAPERAGRLSAVARPA